ncbi:MAG: phytanoyl-CoA dioxygenase family protein [Planctomycetes bacterium]|nr:phytanoyl-CoA dioxygenase family protein [Planctomycetota bacterium]
MTTTLDLDTPCEITQDQIETFRKQGFIHLRDIFSEEELNFYAPIIIDALHERLRTTEQDKGQYYKDTPIAERDTYTQAFIQLGNFWETHPDCNGLILSKRIARIAAELLEVDGVRMYHDQALFKEPGGGFTPWHTDQRYWPMTGDRSITAWIPLQAVPHEMGPMQFASGSQKIIENRFLEISDESEEKIDKMMTINDCPLISEPFDLGDVSFHMGYCFHRASPNTSDKMRAVMTVIYMDKDMVMDEICDRTKGDAEGCCPGISPGEIINSPKNPILWEK